MTDAREPVAPLTLTPIGVVHAAHDIKLAAPRQPVATQGSEGIIELYPGRNFEHALEDLSRWERLWVIFWFHRNRGWRPKVLPPRSTDGRKGVFATRAPHRPNPLGLSVVRLDRVDGLRLHVRDVDMLDGTPVLDIKPYVAYADAFPDASQGWLQPPRDPRTACTVVFDALAERQLVWIAERSTVPLRERIVAVLALGAAPHPYRRIRALRDGQLQLAVHDWRVRFSVAATEVTVHEIRTGYRPAQLAQADGSDPALSLHREFVAIQAAGGGATAGVGP